MGNLRAMSVTASTRPGSEVRPRLSDADYERLLTFRTQLRRFDQWSARRASESGLTHAQHQLLLAIRGHADPRGPTIGDIAGHLLVRHHTAVELTDRTQELGLVVRKRDRDDRRLVRLALTAKGRGRIRALTTAHLDELRTRVPLLAALVEDDPYAAKLSRRDTS